jgi:hypothetical protein
MNLRNSLFYAAGFGVFIALASTASHAILYGWIDENGRVVYGDQPPPNAKPEKLNTSSVGSRSECSARPGNQGRDIRSASSCAPTRQRRRRKDETDGERSSISACGARQDQDLAQ